MKKPYGIGNEYIIGSLGVTGKVGMNRLRWCMGTWKEGKKLGNRWVDEVVGEP